jgi:hypothetical protein
LPRYLAFNVMGSAVTGRPVKFEVGVEGMSLFRAATD